MASEKYSSMEEYYNDIARQSVDRCTHCGNCIRNCILLPRTPVKDNAPDDGQIMEQIMEFLNEGVVSEEVYQRVFRCSSCGACSDSCPEGTDILPAFEAAKMKFAKLGKLAEAVNFVKGIYVAQRVLAAEGFV
jgi:Fe-S oxidoreductase